MSLIHCEWQKTHKSYWPINHLNIFAWLTKIGLPRLSNWNCAFMRVHSVNRVLWTVDNLGICWMRQEKKREYRRKRKLNILAAGIVYKWYIKDSFNAMELNDWYSYRWNRNLIDLINRVRRFIRQLMSIWRSNWEEKNTSVELLKRLISKMFCWQERWWCHFLFFVLSLVSMIDQYPRRKQYLKLLLLLLFFYLHISSNHLMFEHLNMNMNMSRLIQLVDSNEIERREKN